MIELTAPPGKTRVVRIDLRQNGDPSFVQDCDTFEEACRLAKERNRRSRRWKCYVYNDGGSCIRDPW